MVDDDPIDDLRGVSVTVGTALSRTAETLLRAASQEKQRRREEQANLTATAQQRQQAAAVVAERHFAQARRPEWLATAEPREAAATWGAAQTWSHVDPQRFSEHATALNDAFKDRYDVDLRETAQKLGSNRAAMDLGEMRVRRERELEQEATAQRLRQEESDRLRREATSLETQAEVDALSEAQRAELTARAEENRRQADALETPVETKAPEPETTQAPSREHDGPAYDSPERRAQTERDMVDAGVPEPARNARTTSDHINAKNPRESAVAPTKSKKPARRSVAAGRSRDTGRSR